MASKDREGHFHSLFLLVLLGTTLLVGVVGYRLIGNLSLVDSLFYTITTLTTVGYGAPPHMTTELEIFSIALMVGGIGTMGYAIAHLSQKIIINRLLAVMGKRRDRRMDKLFQHWIVCGFGTMGTRVSEELKKKELPFVVIEVNEERCRQASEKGYLVMAGDAREEKILLSAGINAAKGVMIALNDDANNVYVILTVRHLSSHITVFARANSPESMSVLYRAGADKVFSPVNAGALAMANAAIKPEVSDFLEHLSISSDMSLEFGSCYIREGNPLLGKTLAEVPLLSRYNILVIGIRQKEGTIIPTPSGSTTLHEGDTLIILGEEKKLHLALDEM